MAQEIQAVIFDFDGVLVDSEPVHIEAWRQYLENHGQTLDEALLDRMLGRRIIDSAELIVETFELPVTPGTAAQQRNELFLKIAPERIYAKAGAIELMKELDKRGVRMALATSGIREYVELVTVSAGLPDLFDAIVTAEDVEHGKPNPEVFLIAAERLQVAPCHCLVLEDAPNGVMAAASAGMRCFGLPETERAAEQMAQADAVLNGLDGVLGALADHGLSLSSWSQG